MKAYYLVGCVLILLSGNIKVFSQDQKTDNIVVFNSSGLSSKKKGKVYFAVTYDENRGSDISSIDLEANEPWVDKISRKIKGNEKLDFLELEDVTERAYVCYYYQDRYMLEFEFDQQKFRFDGRILRISLPHEVFTYDNVMRIYKYILKRVDMSKKKPYHLELTDDEIEYLLKNK